MQMKYMLDTHTWIWWHMGNQIGTPMFLCVSIFFEPVCIEQ